MKALASPSHRRTRRLAPLILVLALLAVSLLVYVGFADTVVNWAPLGRGTGATALAIDEPAASYDSSVLASSVTGGKASSLGNPSGSSPALAAGDTTAPVVTPKRTPAKPSGAHDWDTGNVTLTWDITDPESAIATRSGCDAVNITADQSEITYTCVATNTVGLAGRNSIKIKRDAHAPNAPKIVAKKADGSDYAPDTWTNQNVTVSFDSNGDNGPSQVETCTHYMDITGDQNSPETGNCIDNAGNIGPDAAPIRVKVDKTKPLAFPQPDKAGVNNWYMPPLNINWNWADGGSGVNTARCTAKTPVMTEGANTLPAPGQVITCYDLAGNVGTPAPITVNLDRTPPKYNGTTTAVSNNVSYTPGTWTRFPVIASFNCVETTPGSGVVTNPVVVTWSTEGANQTIPADAALCKDNAGWTASASASYGNVYIDTTNPNPPTVVVDPAPNSAGWNNSHQVTVSFVSNGDAGTTQSGVVSCTPPVTLNAETAGTEVSGTCTDKAGNVSAAASKNVKIDFTQPVITLLNPPGSYLVGCDAKPEYTVDANISGLAGSNVQGPTLVTASDGSVVNRYVITAQDVAGNTTSVTVDYPAYKLDDPFFLPPVDAHSTALFNLGSVVPIKFQLRDCSGKFLLNADARLMVVYDGPAAATTQNIKPASNQGEGDTGDRFRLVGDTYMYNWKTKGLWIGNYTISVKIGGVVLRSAHIGLR